MPIASINPATGETLQTFEPLSQTQLDEKLQLAHETFHSYRRTSFADRARMLTRAAEILETEKKDCARVTKMLTLFF